MSKKISDVKTKGKVRKHLSDQNDTITDADIKRAATDFSGPPVVSGTGETGKKINNDSDPGIGTPWNVLSE